MADWSTLHFDLLNEIVIKFETIEDLVYFSAVCRWWNHLATMVKHKFTVKVTPWLLFGENIENNPDCLRKVYNPFNNKYYQLKLPETFGCRCWGSEYGWLVTYSQSLDLKLFNPLTRATMSLPPVTSLPYLGQAKFPNPDALTLGRMRNFFIRKAFLVKVNEDDFIVFLTYYYTWKKLAFARPGDQSWTSIDHLGRTPDTAAEAFELSGRGSCAEEVICRGTRILILYRDASLAYLDISDLSDPGKLIVNKYIPRFPMRLSDPRNLCIKVRRYMRAPPEIMEEFVNEYNYDLFASYLVDCYGDIFMVLRDKLTRDPDRLGYATYGFKVYRLDIDNKKWSQVHQLDDNVFFIGNGPSMSVPAVRAPNCNSNSIYYTDDENDGHGNEPAWGDDMGVFNLENQTIVQMCEEYSTDSKVQAPLWFMPRW